MAEESRQQETGTRPYIDISGIVRADNYLALNVIVNSAFHSVKLEEGALSINEQHTDNREVLEAVQAYHNTLEKENELPLGEWQQQIEEKQERLFSALSRHLG